MKPGRSKWRCDEETRLEAMQKSVTLTTPHIVGFGFRVSGPPPIAELVGKQITVDDYSIA
jgi:hypothetical protein